MLTGYSTTKLIKTSFICCSSNIRQIGDMKSAINQPTEANPIEKLVIKDKKLSDSIAIAGACNEHFAFVGKNIAAQIENLTLSYPGGGGG